MNFPASDIKWSTELKHSELKIDGKTVRQISNQDKEWHFSLLEVGFSHEVKAKQRWGIKINSKNGWGILLGMCLMSTMKKNNFNSKKNWSEIKKSLYAIYSHGCCLPHDVQ